MTGQTVSTCPEPGCIVWTPHVHGGHIVVPKRESGKCYCGGIAACLPCQERDAADAAERGAGG